MNSDDPLIAVLEDVCRQPLAPNAAILVRDAMAQHPEFAKPHARYYLGDTLMLDPMMQCGNLLSVATQRGASNAIEWYRKLINANEAPVRLVAELSGLFVPSAVRLSNGVNIVNLKQLPDSMRARIMRSFDTAEVFEFSHKAFAVHELGIVKLHSSYNGNKDFIDPLSKVKDTVEALCLDGSCCTVITKSWVEFSDMEFEFAQSSFQHRMTDTDGALPRGIGQLVENAVSWVEAYLKLSEETRNYLRLPISRLNMAMRDFMPENKAIDGSICLDALIGSGRDNHIRHELGVKSALLLGLTAQEREQIYYDVKEFYSLRNEAVHPGKDKNITDPEGTASRGLGICLRLLRTLIIRGEKLEWGSDFAEKGGPLWNRFRWDIPSRDSKRPQASMGG